MKNGIKKAAAFFFLVATAIVSTVNAQTLSGRRFCIDPGHGGHNPANDRRIELDPGNVFWESEGNFQKALRLDTLLQQQGAFVILTRYTNDYPNDNDEPTLTQRWQLANANNVHWFHSIHSNAFNGVTNYTLVLLKEDIPTRQPAFPEALVMSNIIAPKIQTFLRTPPPSRVALDYTFYGGPNGGFNLGVLRGLVMPGELSEGSFHDVLSEYRKLQNLSYNKAEAYALRNSFMQYYSVPADTMGIIAGLLSEIGTGRAINLCRVRLLPENRVYNGDQFNNGFYMFDRVAPGSKRLRFETPGFSVDSATITVGTGGLVFFEKQLESFAAPTIVSSIPANGDTMFSADRSIVLQFSKAMDTASVRVAFSITPSAPGRLLWSNANSLLTFDPNAVLPFFVHYTVRVDTQARSAGGQQIDGDGNGVPGDPYVLRFRTRDVDAFPPQIIASYPSANTQLKLPTTVLNVTFDEYLNPNTVSVTNIAVQQIGGSLLSRTLQYWESGLKSGVNIYLAAPLDAGASYRIRVSGVTDLVGNPIPNSAPIIWEFSVAPHAFSYTSLDSLDVSVAHWQQPLSNTSTVGVDSARFLLATNRYVPPILNNIGSGQLTYRWQAGANSWLLREQMLSGAGRNVRFRKERNMLTTFAHGDGSLNQFRFAVQDSLGFEVSKWFTVDWIGWRQVDWDAELDSLGTWNGNGNLDGELRFDSFQMRYLPGTSVASGQLFFDQLQLATKMVTSVESDGREGPAEFSLEQNYPNPFNPSTRIAFSVQGSGFTSLKVFDLLGREVATLVNENLTAGSYRVKFDASGLASGVFFYRLVAGGQALTRKMVVAK
jgi:N-acetylmuramoyl-L-alanine amidase